MKIDFKGNLYVVRHGETKWNQEHRYQGWTDIPLAEIGEKQAQAVAEKLSKNQIEIIITSPLKRAWQTARIISEFLNIAEIEVIDDFKERDYGAFDGLTKMQATERFTDLIAQNITHQWRSAPPEGETLFDFEERVLAGLNKIHSKYAGKRLLLVCHVGVMRILNKYFNNVGDDEAFFNYFPDNGEIVVY